MSGGYPIHSFSSHWNFLFILKFGTPFQMGEDRGFLLNNLSGGADKQRNKNCCQQIYHDGVKRVMDENKDCSVVTVHYLTNYSSSLALSSHFTALNVTSLYKIVVWQVTVHYLLWGLTDYLSSLALSSHFAALNVTVFMCSGTGESYKSNIVIA